MSDPRENMLERIGRRNSQNNPMGVVGDLRQMEIDLLLEDVADSMPDEKWNQYHSLDERERDGEC